MAKMQAAPITMGRAFMKKYEAGSKRQETREKDSHGVSFRILASCFLFPASCLLSQISLLNLRFISQFLRRPRKGDLAGFQDVTAVGALQGEIGVLFHQEDRDSLPVDLFQGLK